MPLDPIAKPSLLGQPTRPIETGRERRQLARAQRFDQALDEAELTSVDGVEAAEPLRSVKANEEEESHEDRAGHGYYHPDGRVNEGPERPRLDIKG